MATTLPEQQSSEPGPSEARPDTKQLPYPRRDWGGAPAVAAVRMEPVTLWVIGRVEHFPRRHRFTVGDRWIETCLEVQTSLVEASYVGRKRELLLSASRGLVRARVLARMAAALRCISLDQEAHLQRETSEIGRMIGGWIRSLGRRRPPRDVGPGATL